MKARLLPVSLALAAGAGLLALSAAPGDEEPASISMIRLLADPDAWHGREVYLTGFVRFEGGQGALFFHDVDEEYGLSHNAVLLDLSGPESGDAEWVHRDAFVAGLGRYAFLSGTFDARQRGPYGEYAGTLVRIEQLRPWGAPAQGELGGDPHGPEAIPFVRLLANPQDFDGHWVRLIGPASFEFEGTVIYLGPDDDRVGQQSNGVWLRLTGEQYESNRANHGKWMIVEGLFDAADKGHLGAFSGALGAINRLEVWPWGNAPKTPETRKPAK